MRQRLKFRKEGPIRFVGHLDLMRTFQKTFRRANIPIAYSEGFNPHQVFSFATALAVGISSEGEYVDLKLTQDVPVEVIMAAVNNTTPPGIHVEAGVILQDKEPKAMAALAAAQYHIDDYKQAITPAMIEALLKQSEVIVQKTNKKGKVKDFDLRPGIYDLQVEKGQVRMLIATGSEMNIKPEMILQVLLEKTDTPYERGDFAFHRKELFHRIDGDLQPLLVPKLR